MTSIPIATVGFVLTYRQARKAKDAAEAAEEATTRSTENISRASLLVLIPQMQRVEEELEQAVREKSIDLTISWLSTWRWQAGQARGFLNTSNADELQLLDDLQTSVTAARNAKSRLIETGAPDVVKSTKQALQAIGRVTGELGSLAASYGMQLGGATNGRG
ncbi:hypothetical protein ACFVOR_19145 [Streptomyces sp. NPDC057837]|uniref:hypothetical protein n=1 Tax=Streptomyces sp. NPDC057837 TaxID=3346260 RepID=UPI0036AB9EA1